MNLHMKETLQFKIINKIIALQKIAYMVAQKTDLTIQYKQYTDYTVHTVYTVYIHWRYIINRTKKCENEGCYASNNTMLNCT